MAETRTIPLAQVQALSQKWDDETEGRSDVASFAIRSCADQLDALIASASPSPWRPIAEARRDGTEYLLWCASGVDIGNWQEDKSEARESGVIVDPGLPAGWYGYLGLCPWDSEQPTHFMPKPDPPPAPASERPETEPDIPARHPDTRP